MEGRYFSGKKVEQVAIQAHVEPLFRMKSLKENEEKGNSQLDEGKQIYQETPKWGQVQFCHELRVLYRESTLSWSRGQAPLGCERLEGSAEPGSSQFPVSPVIRSTWGRDRRNLFNKPAQLSHPHSRRSPSRLHRCTHTHTHHGRQLTTDTIPASRCGLGVNRIADSGTMQCGCVGASAKAGTNKCLWWL